MNWAHIENVGILFASLRNAAAADFGIFLLLCFAAALGLAAVIIGAILSIAILGARRAAARTGPARQAVAKAPPTDRPLLILYASETGNSRELAVAAGAAAQRLGIKVRVADMAAAGWTRAFDGSVAAYEAPGVPRETARAADAVRAILDRARRQQ